MKQKKTHRRLKVNEQLGLDQKLGVWTRCTGRVGVLSLYPMLYPWHIPYFSFHWLNANIDRYYVTCLHTTAYLKTYMYACMPLTCRKKWIKQYLFTYNMPILYSDRLILRQLVVSWVKKKSAFECIIHWTLIGSFLLHVRWIRVNNTKPVEIGMFHTSEWR